MPILEEPGISREFLIRHTRLMLASYYNWTGKVLWPEDKADEDLVNEVYEAPFVLCSTGPQKDPILNYGNAQALKLWEMDWTTFTHTLGSATAESQERAAREKFLKTVKDQGFIDNYQGIRISKSGRRFEIKKATVWNLIDPQGRFAGQAATFSEWKVL